MSRILVVGRAGYIGSRMMKALTRAGYEPVAFDASKIEWERGWAPTESFKTVLSKTVRWYLENEGWWSHIIDGGYRLDRIGAREVTL